MKTFFRAALAAAAVLTSIASPAQQITLAVNGQEPSITVPKAVTSMDLAAIDKSIAPCTDFYAYACGTWIKNNPIPSDKVTWGKFGQLAEYNQYSLYALLKEAAEHPKTPLQAKYGNYFAACMDDEGANRLGAKPLQPALAEIDGLKDKAKLAALAGKLEDANGLSLFYAFGSQQDQKDSSRQIPVARQAGLSLPDRDYYLQDDARMTKIRQQYLEHLTKMFALLGDQPDKATAEAQAVLKIETALAKVTMPRAELRDPANRYHMQTLAEMQASTPDYRWSDYLSAIHTPVTSLNNATPNFLKGMDAVIASTSLDDLKSYVRWNVLHNVASKLSKDYVDENFRFFNAILGGQKEQAPLWKRCTQSTDSALGEAVGQDWVAKYFTPAAKANMQELVHQLEAALGDDIKTLDWMSPTTKVEAEKKLLAFRDKIGYPEVWRDYSTLSVKRDDRAGNVLRADVFADRRDLAKIGKPVNEKEWSMSPPTVNAYYSPSQNDINFPAGILQPPFYDFKIDPAVNFGGIGVVIGHEMTHGFDDQGSKYDPQGNVRMWWTPTDKAEFDKRTECEVNEYGNFDVAPGQKLNGKLTLGENTADNGGMAVAYMALHKELARLGPDAQKPIDGYTTDQRFFLGFAQLWCENTREETAVLRAKSDPHSTGQWRVNGTVQNSAKFAEAFSCKQGQPMAPTDACRVW
jgi:putative endopeptidase